MYFRVPKKAELKCSATTLVDSTKSKYDNILVKNWKFPDFQVFAVVYKYKKTRRQGFN